MMYSIKKYTRSSLQKLAQFLLLTIFLTSCTHRIVRTDYKLHKSDHIKCNVEIRKEVSLADSVANKVGEIKLRDTGIAVACNESHAIDILKGEACALGADLIVITDENRPDFWSSCYRCNASFYKLTQAGKEQIAHTDNNTAGFSEEEVRARVGDDQIRNTAVFVSALATGFLLFVVIF